jgi:hypothetical protein
MSRQQRDVHKLTCAFFNKECGLERRGRTRGKRMKEEANQRDGNPVLPISSLAESSGQEVRQRRREVRLSEPVSSYRTSAHGVMRASPLTASHPNFSTKMNGLPLHVCCNSHSLVVTSKIHFSLQEGSSSPEWRSRLLSCQGVSARHGSHSSRLVRY